MASDRVLFGAVASNNNNAVSQQVLAFTNAGGINPCIVGIANIDGGAGQTVSSMTYGAANLSKVIAANDGTARRVEIWQATGGNIPTGANNLTANFGAATDVVLACLSFFGVDQANPARLAVSISGTSATPALLVSPGFEGGMIVSSMCDGGVPTGQGANQTQLWLNSTPATLSSIGSRGTVPTHAAGNNDTYTISTSSTFVICGCVIMPAPRRRA